MASLRRQVLGIVESVARILRDAIKAELERLRKPNRPPPSPTVAIRPDGLFLGAGASCEIGMPLVRQLTEELRLGLHQIDFRALNRDKWLPRGDGYPLSIVEDMYSMLERKDVHYEALLGYLETQQQRPQNNANLQHYHGLRTRLVEIVYNILYSRHLKSADLAADARKLSGIGALATTAPS